MKIRVFRKKELVNFATSYQIYVDGVKVENLTVTQDYVDLITDNLNPKISVKVQWCGSNSLVLKNVSNELEVSSRIGFISTSIIIILMFFIGYMSILYNKSLVFLIFVPYLYPLYYITLGKNEYLELNFK